MVQEGADSTQAVVTLAFDVGGSGLKATALAADGTMLADRMRVPTPYPLLPSTLVDILADLAAQLPTADRASVGFPGMVRGGCVLTAPHFSRAKGPGTKVAPSLARAWQGFDLTAALGERLGMPVRVANDADVQGSAVVAGKGLEMAVTLGTGFGTALFDDGRLLPHMEIAHHPFLGGKTYDECIGDVARKRIGNQRWSRRVRKAVAALDSVLFFDRIYVGGGNSHRIKVDLGPKATIVDNTAGLLGGLTLWDRSSD